MAKISGRGVNHDQRGAVITKSHTRSGLIHAANVTDDKETRSFKARQRDGQVHNALNGQMMMTHTFDIHGMACEHCVVAVERALDTVDGIDRFSVRVGFAEVRATRWTERTVILSAIENEGYRVIT